MTPFFSTPSALEALSDSAASWDGTPFAPASSCKGPNGGVCCHRLCVGVLSDAGFPISQAEIPDSPLNRATHHPGSLIGDWLESQSDRFERAACDLAQAQPGDVVVIRLGVGAHHTAVVLPGRKIMQAWQGIGAHISTQDDARLQKRVYAVFRPISA